MTHGWLGSAPSVFHHYKLALSLSSRNLALFMLYIFLQNLASGTRVFSFGYFSIYVDFSFWHNTMTPFCFGSCWFIVGAKILVSATKRITTSATVDGLSILHLYFVATNLHNGDLDMMPSVLLESLSKTHAPIITKGLSLS